MTQFKVNNNSTDNILKIKYRTIYIKITFNLFLYNVPKWPNTLLKSCSKCGNIFKVCLTILGRYEWKGWELNIFIHILSCYCTQNESKFIKERYIKDIWFLEISFLEMEKVTQSRPLITSFRNQSIDLHCQSRCWFQYETKINGI